MASQKLGDVVADSMHDILNSEEHQGLFNKTAAAKPCCSCKGKCSKKCPCKEDGKCKKACAGCVVDKKVEKKAEKTCCECGEKCSADCDCKGKCGDDCGSCGDGMMTSSEQEDRALMIQGMMEMLNKVCELQDALGLEKSAAQTISTIETVLAEVETNFLGKTAQDMLEVEDALAAEDINTDTNDVKAEDILSDKPGLFDEGLSVLEDEGVDDEASTMAWLKFKKDHPDLVGQMESRIQNVPNELEVDWEDDEPTDSETEKLLANYKAPETYDTELLPERHDTEMGPASEALAWQPPPVAPNTEEKLQEDLLNRINKTYGNDHVDSPLDYTITPKERDNALKSQLNREKDTGFVEAFKRLDQLLKRSNLEDLEMNPDDFETSEHGLSYENDPQDYEVKVNKEWVPFSTLSPKHQLDMEHRAGLFERDYDLDPDMLSEEQLPDFEEYSDYEPVPETSEEEWEGFNSYPVSEQHPILKNDYLE